MVSTWMMTEFMVLGKSNSSIVNEMAIQDVDEFVSSSEQIRRNVALHHLLTNKSAAVNGCRQNEAKSNMFVRNKSIKTFLT